MQKKLCFLEAAHAHGSGFEEAEERDRSSGRCCRMPVDEPAAQHNVCELQQCLALCSSAEPEHAAWLHLPDHPEILPWPTQTMLCTWKGVWGSIVPALLA